jgi:hypothetical protein
MAEARGGIGELNSVGEPDYELRSEYGGRTGTGPLDQCLPTGEVATGNEVKARDVFERGERRGASVTRNESQLRSGGRRK